MKNEEEKALFKARLKDFAASLAEQITLNGEWTMRGLIDIFKNVYALSSDTKVVSKILELHLFPQFIAFAKGIGYKIELASHQNWYPDLTFINLQYPSIKFAVDLKTTYRDPDNSDFCRGFTLGSHGEYFTQRDSAKNIQYPYNEYSGHFCLGIIYARSAIENGLETKICNADTINEIPAVIRDFTFFAEEKWRIASDKSGSGNTANIGSIQKISDILSGNGVFANGRGIF